MSKSKHTPGPWSVDHTTAHISINQSNSKTIASIHVPTFDATWEDVANAALIATAPEMYELIDKINAAFYCRTSRKDWIEIMEQTKPLLMKARGEK